jgi:Do/DeqQ family serine protease
MRHLIGFFIALVLATAAPAQTTVPESQAQIALSFAPVVRAAAPAVVNVFVTRVVPGRASPFMDDPFFSQFFGDLGARVPKVQRSLGSGVIVSAEGIVVSNYHVVGDATDIRVVLHDRREFDAKVLLADKGADLAVLKLEGADDLPSLSLRDSDEVEVGELVLAIGNPFGIGQTVSGGIVSGLARSGLSVGDDRGYFIQTDAAINPGNSGGALVDLSGRLVGINTAILSRSGGSNGIGFAIPANLVRQFVQQAENGNDRFMRPWAGVAGQTVDGSLAQGFGLPVPAGVVLSEMHPQSPFARAGLAVGDIVTTIDGAEVNSPQEMLFRMTVAGIGSRVTAGYLRDGAARQADVALIAPPEVPARDRIEIGRTSVLRGLVAENINPAVIAELDLPTGAQGVVAVSVSDLAGRVGLRAGDILVHINGMAIGTTDDLRRAAKSRSRNWQIDLIRDGQQTALRFRV